MNGRVTHKKCYTGLHPKSEIEDNLEEHGYKSGRSDGKKIGNYR